MWFGPVVGFIVGFLMGNFDWRSGLFLGIIGFLIQGRILLGIDSKKDGKSGFLAQESDYINAIIGLAAMIVKADGKTDFAELNYIEVKLRKDFSSHQVQKLMVLLQKELNQSTKHHLWFTRFVADEFDNSSKIQLMHFLIGIATVDGVLADKELTVLKNIATKIELNYRTFESILAMFRFRRENFNQQNKSSQKSSTSKIKEAYKILEIDETASDSEIKKAYKKLAVKHHPDKVIHLGEEFQKIAKEKFQIIVAAYDILQKHRKFI